DQVACHKACRTQDHGEALEVGPVDEGQDPLLELSERFLGNRLLVLLGFQVAAGKQGDEVLQLAAAELRRERHAQHVGVSGVVDVVVDILEPPHGWQELGSSKGLVVLFDGLQEVGRNGKMAEVVNGLPQQVAAVGFVYGDLRHGKISLGKLFSGRIDTDKDLGDRLNIEVFRQLDDADMVVDDLPKLFQYARDAFAVSVRIPLGVVIRELHQAGIRGEDICH